MNPIMYHTQPHNNDTILRTKINLNATFKLLLKHKQHRRNTEFDARFARPLSKSSVWNKNKNKSQCSTSVYELVITRMKYGKIEIRTNTSFTYLHDQWISTIINEGKWTYTTFIIKIVVFTSNFLLIKFSKFKHKKHHTNNIVICTSLQNYNLEFTREFQFF